MNTTLKFESIYDDNICHYSDATLEDFRRGEHPDEFAIETSDDLILSSALAFELRRPLLGGKPTRLRVRYTRWDYTRNPIKTNDEINLRFRQHFRKSDYFEATYTYAPDNYIKELSDRPPFTSRTVPREYLHFEITRNSFSWGYRYRLTRWLSGKVFGGRTLRFYNRPFLENDLWEWNFYLEDDLTLHRFTLRLRYAYAKVRARGYDSVGETLENSDNDGDGSVDEADEDQYGDGDTNDSNETITYSLYDSSVDADSTADDLGRQTGAGSRQLVAENITALSFTYLDKDGNSLPSPVDTSAVRWVVISMAARTARSDPGFSKTRTLTCRVNCRNLGL